eukprot:TRINITY_DN38743_c0_g2_i1.p2 TRINITY_DN38743_c0_g2~~TRINITY_DN38743_c0_g2_i1.p2  ORF type:complete len:123 (+),score=2.65 TRINITY_DN38743_c0_g2_i1:27-395(+)
MLVPNMRQYNPGSVQQENYETKLDISCDQLKIVEATVPATQTKRVKGILSPTSAMLDSIQCCTIAILLPAPNAWLDSVSSAVVKPIIKQRTMFNHVFPTATAASSSFPILATNSYYINCRVN